MCNGHYRSLFRGSLSPYQTSVPENGDAFVVDNLRGRLEETESRLAQVRAREAELSRLLEEMKRLVSVMEILENYLKRQYNYRQEYVVRLLSPSSLIVFAIKSMDIFALDFTFFYNITSHFVSISQSNTGFQNSLAETLRKSSISSTEAISLGNGIVELIPLARPIAGELSMPNERESMRRMFC
ncbi:unnamed protein product [Citrullus colocynthis]|uniref:Uncharacterized protein n=1 Tax=Citrullus colocynthis TaxID=252529 RepID=A0ABP0YPW4_9ROSI